MRALSPVIINKDKEQRAHKHAPDTQQVHTHTHTMHIHTCHCDKYGFSQVRIIHRGHLQDILGPFELPPTSQKQGSNERGRTRAVLTGGAIGAEGGHRRDVAD